MADDSARASSDFLTVACELGILSQDSAQRLADEATLREISAEHLALKQGLLSAIQVDMVQTLQNPFDTIPGYEIQGVLGQGGMGVVYSARQSNLQRDVALKTVLLSLMTDASVVARFQQEAVAVARLRHPNIIAAFDFGRHSGRLFFVMELIEGEDLNKLIDKKGALDEATAWGLARQIAAGLAHAEQEGIVHRDIKPANILLVTPPAGFPLPPGLPMVKIADFGLAFLGAEKDVNTRLTAANTTLGSPHYMAPEQLTNSQVDLRADIYALGITVFQMLTGSLPFSGQITEVLAQKLRGNIPDVRTLRPNVSLSSSELIAVMTQVEPKNRPASYRELFERIDRVLQEIAGTPAVSQNSDLIGASKRAQGESPTDIATQKTIVVENKPKGRQAWLMTAVVSLAIIIGGFLIVKQRQKTVSEPETKVVLTGWREYLFKGSLKDWGSVSGQWSDAYDDDGAKILAGTNGSVRRELTRLVDGVRQPLENYRITLGVCLHEASAVEVQFDILIGKTKDTKRSVGRIERDGRGWVATRAADSSALSPPTTDKQWKVEPDQHHSVVLERINKVWRFKFDGQVVGELPVSDQPTLPEFRLAAVNGPAWFSDIEIEELALERPDSNR